ncbi:27634_t:CDS:1, partial [Racocetra persica]
TKDKLYKHRGTIVKKIKDELFEVFQEKLNKIDSSASADAIKAFKESANTKWCLRKLNLPISTMLSQTYMDLIVSKVWAKDQPTEDDKVFAIAVCFYILDSKYKGMKLDLKK